jgi:hypothetical protein
VSISNYLENIILDHILRNQAFTPPSTVYVALHTADPGETGASEVTGGSYARQAVTFGAASGGAVSNTGAINFPAMPAVTVTHASLWDASTAGNCLWTGALAASKVINSGDTPTFPIGDIDVAVD